MLALLFLFGIFVSEVHCGYYFVTAPNVIRFDHEETVVVSVFGLTNAKVKVWLQLGYKQFSEKNVIVEDQKTPFYTSVRVTENDTLSTEDEEKVRKVKLCAEWNGKKQTREILLSYHTGYMITQTDKPIYTPNQKVKVRTLALDESLQAVKGWQVYMDIVSPSNKTLYRKFIEHSPNGFYQNEFALPPYPDIGIWTARTFYKGQIETESHALFEVREYVLPTFGVTVDVDVEYILPDRSTIIITVKAKYVYGKPVKGNARLTLKLKGDDMDTDYILDVGRKQLEISRNIEGSVTEFSLDIQDIYDSPLLKDKPFPDGKRLEVIATVFESATGNEEAASHDTTFFTKSPFVFKFSKSKLKFRPGYGYYLKVDVLYVNGNPAHGVNVLVTMYEDFVFKERVLVTTNEYGRITQIFSTSAGTRAISFKIGTSGGEYESSEFEVTAYTGKNQIQVESVTTEKHIMLLRAFTNIKGNSYTGMLFMVITRGKIVYTNYKNPGNEASEEILEELQEIVSPNARLLVFYVDKTTHELVADSIKFEVEKKCRGAGLHLETQRRTVSPGGVTWLTVTGSPFMHVGLNIIDKSPFPLNDKNVLTKNKMFETLQSHDLGCGEGSGRSAADVFKKSGLTVLTNANIDEADLERTNDGCKGKTRKRRDVDSCMFGTADKCCEMGYEMAERIFEEQEHQGSIIPIGFCQLKTLTVAKQKRLSAKCVMALYKSCVAELEYLKEDITGITLKSIVESDYLEDIAVLKEHAIYPRTRSDSRESWLFDTIKLDADGQLNTKLNVPDSVTEWSIQAIGITKNKGMCIADPVDLTAFRDFFIQLDLPYKAARLEHFNVKATIFNYGMLNDMPKTVNVYLRGVDNLCYNSDTGKPSPKVKVNLPPNSAKTVSFPVIPLKDGHFPVRVSAIDTDLGIPLVDEIEKNLYVVNEGIKERLNIIVCLGPLKKRNDCVNDKRVKGDVQFGNDGRHYEIDLTLPNNSISQTGSAMAYIQSSSVTNVVNTIINGVDRLLRKPAGSGEGTMIRLAPTVYALGYLKEAKQMTVDIGTKGNKWVRDGVNREISGYKHADGAYSIWRHRTASTWLTAFVAKVFCQANEVVDGALDKEKDIKITIDWLNDHVNNDGSFTDVMPVIHREMIGQMNEKDSTLTAFVLITLQECGITSDKSDTTIRKAITFLENLPNGTLKNNPYLLAISTYALALSDSPKKYTFKELLLEIKKDAMEGCYWGNPGGKPASAQSVETTAYALLAMLKFNDIKRSSSIVSWLIAQRDFIGSFRTTQDTVVGLQALSQYRIATYHEDVNLNVTLSAHDWQGTEIHVTSENAIAQHVITNLPVERGNNRLRVKVLGTGSAVMSIDLHYNRPAMEEESCPFSITDIDVQDVEYLPTDQGNCDVCGFCDDKNDNQYDADNATKKCILFSVSSKNKKKTYGMSIVKFGLETGVEVFKSDLDKLVAENNSNIARYEMPSDGKGFIVFYLHEISSRETKFIFRLKDNFDGEITSRQPSSVYVYDYHNPEKRCTQLYGTGPNRGNIVSYQCRTNQTECKCFHSMCVKPVQEKITTLAQAKKRPSARLYKYACNPDKANYAVSVRITQVSNNLEAQEKLARGVVEDRLNNGIEDLEDLEDGDEMIFYWKNYCTYPELSEGKSYIIIGKDGHKIDQDGEEIFRYPLMGTTLVIEDVTVRQPGVKMKRRRTLLQTALINFKRLMSRKGCQN